MEIRGIRADEWAALRDLRLRALEDSPDAFSSLLDDERAQPDERWRDLARRGAAGESDSIVVASDPAGLFGMAGAFVPQPGGAAVVWGMWVDPRRRGSGAGGAMLDALVAWAREVPGVRGLHLSVTEGNAPAEALYLGFGFETTGRREPLREGSELSAAEMELSLVG
ncbi:MAG: GNAT family N-acetyltransferase [Actinomycetota bacterium]